MIQSGSKKIYTRPSNILKWVHIYNVMTAEQFLCGLEDLAKTLKPNETIRIGFIEPPGLRHTYDDDDY